MSHVKMESSAFNSIRLLMKEGEVRFEIYADVETMERVQSGSSADFVIMCYGCPSHPFDHSAAVMGHYLNAGLVLVYPSYIGTWGSTGVCTLENAVDTIDIVTEAIRRGSGREIRSGRVVSWSASSISLMGGSFGGSVVLVSAAKSKVDAAVAISPVIDWRKHGTGPEQEEELSKTYAVIEEGFSELWRIDEGTYDALRQGQLDLNPVDYLKELSKVPAMIIHAKDDPQVSCRRTREFAAALERMAASVESFFPDTGGHLILYHMGQSIFATRIIDWMSAVRRDVSRDHVGA